ncbi:hypothetical protein [Chamaesiphon polymorphus]|uniref:Uncharacterized protein n=1 Tax=Chamaesiphon polymorphus CCALA 037 TaxID=2107692 RepID=A0A2T1G0G3_9CYAN|nr:hypothetical protein [Chamaesiphon polymorphus]PSB50717.1 hypothetical protein C7B77_22465 [Chamaesiphon polymorphus CCALA 037]
MKNMQILRNVLVVLGSIGSLSAIGLSFVSDAVANPIAKDRMQRVPTNILRGNLVPPSAAGGALSYPVFQTDCSKITVSLTNNGKVLASAQATGTYITNGCQFSLAYQNLNTVMRANSPNFQISASGGRAGDYIISGRDSLAQPLPSQFDLKVDKAYTGPK